MALSQLRSIYQLKITLVGSKPPIWRRILVSNNMVLDEFHLALQITMGWTNSHLHQFIANGHFYGIYDDEFDFGMEIKDESEYKLNQLLKSEKDSIIYEYDFGDGWEHKILLEKILPFNKDKRLPYCEKGKRSCPPEDCGGIWGYKDLIDVINDIEDPEHESMLEWLGDEFDPETFDLEQTNKILAEYVR
ncbi:MAG: plasmid pRiA4b ORF-3 family protein [Methylococcaceae bacterium]|nr:plasmid pRiA4b ORF-3 family protein [Methylococcaceae bacterium]